MRNNHEEVECAVLRSEPETERYLDSMCSALDRLRLQRNRLDAMHSRVFGHSPMEKACNLEPESSNPSIRSRLVEKHESFSDAIGDVDNLITSLEEFI